jgi:opacity protein-like surface antigen
MKHPLSFFLTAFFLVIQAMLLHAQDLDALLNEATNSDTEFASATFKSTRIINGHSIERMPGGQLEFRIHHRFGPVNSGAYEMWGLDQASIHFGLEYGITDWVMAGIGRGTYEKAFDGFLKFSLLRQSKGERNMPVSLSYFASSTINSLKWEGPGTLNFWDRVSYVHQVLIARKFSERFSLEFNPTYVHRNMVDTELDPNDLWAFGGGARFKITKRFSLNGEYYYVIPGDLQYNGNETYNSFSVGVDIETGGHVFTLLLTNSQAMIEKGFIGETTGSWQNGGIRLGFNISRVFALK